MFTKILKTLLKKEYSDDTDDISVHIDEYKPKKTQSVDCIWWNDSWYFQWQKASVKSFIKSRKADS